MEQQNNTIMRDAMIIIIVIFLGLFMLAKYVFDRIEAAGGLEGTHIEYVEDAHEHEEGEEHYEGDGHDH